ncbi:MAG: hypothetical protein RMJ43_05185 [Chloroherpetonaceae bacterium]|nr:hypothetical protein [Chthonomonadaceae bacterium]MDW8207210.1 hypothetical protein [Chloroherpetonaceae bacterium]
MARYILYVVAAVLVLTLFSAGPAKAQEEPVVLRAGETVDSLVVDGRPLDLAGEVKHDVIVFNSEVRIRPGARVGGRVIVVDGTIRDEAGGAVRATLYNGSYLRKYGVLRVDGTGLSKNPAASPGQAEDWRGNQIALFMLGLIGVLVMRLLAPRATVTATEVVALDPGRALVMGLLGALGLLVAALINALIARSPVGMVWSPVGVLVGVTAVILLGAGWLCGMRLAGDLIARRLGWRSEGAVYPRIALGLLGFCLAKLLAYGVSSWLGGAVLLLEAAFALMGLGALILSGFGSNPDWLHARLHRERHWMSGT